MTYLINSLNRAVFVLAVTVLLSACAGQTPPQKPLRVAAVQIEAEGTRVLLDALQWSCVVENGSGQLNYEYLVRRAGIASRIYEGPVAEFRWTPKQAGAYQLKVIVRDSTDRQAESSWSAVYNFSAPVSESGLYAVWPIENLSANAAPLGKIREMLVTKLRNSGLAVLEDERMEDFMRDARIRYVGGLDPQTARQLADELGVAGVILTSLETWHERGIPRVSLLSRLVVNAELPEVAWIDSIGLNGDDHTGLLGLGRITDPRQLAATAVEQLVGSLLATLQGVAPGYRHSVDAGQLQLVDSSQYKRLGYQADVKKTHRPRTYFRDQQFDPTREYRVAIVPFLNINARKDSGKIVALHLLQQLQRYENIRVYEPGVIRDVLLSYRMIMQAGPSLAAADILASDTILGADLIMSGKVFDFQDGIGETRVDFSTQVFSGGRREVIWTSHSYAGGDDGVYFFDIGKIASTHDLLRPMAQAVVRLLED
ncbi:MAG: hypothetical protein JXQ81_00445 [Desulfuromonadales bacterium]|nr:hypothetical protein [Desulfuromonadales bacterium]MBN2790952.1 hypothetical protein [Desulfuromonadales bacterium]